MQKRGQFYLIGALILIIVLVGFATVTNYTKKKTGADIEGLSEELKIEGAKMLDYNTINDEDKIENFTKTFSEYAGDNVDINYIFGSEGNLKLYNGTGLVGSLSSSGGKILATINGMLYEFDLKSGENFYFVISQEIEGEQYVVTN